MRNIFFLCSTLIWLVSGQEDCNSDDCGIPSLGKAMLGYDVGRSDPYSYPDPGNKQDIFSPTARTGGAGANPFIRHPFIAKALQEVICNGEFSSKSFRSYSDYTKEKSKNIEWDVGASFEASGSFAGFSAEVSAKYRYSESKNDRSVKKFFEEVQGEMEQASAVCQYYVVEKSTLVEPIFTSAFKRFLVEVDKIAKTNEEQRKDGIFTEFVNAYGTHYQVKTRLGARIIFQRMYESRAKSTSERNERSKCAKHEAEGCAGGGGSAFGIEAKAKACASGSHKKCEGKIDESSKLDSRGYESRKVITLGSGPASSIDDWGANVGKFGGVVLSFSLQKITNLFKQRIFEVNNITSENGEPLNPQLMTSLFNDRMARYCELILDGNCPEEPTGCGIIGSCEDNEKCIPDATEDLGYRCEVRATPQERKSCEKECRQKESSFRSKCGLFTNRYRTQSKRKCGLFGLFTCRSNGYGYSTDYGSAKQCRVSLDATCQAKCENKNNYDGLTKKVDQEVKKINKQIKQGNEQLGQQIKQGNKNILKNVKTVQENQVKLVMGQLDLKENQKKVLQNQLKLSTGQEVIKEDITKVISNQLIQKMNQKNLFLGQNNLLAGQSALNAGQKDIKANQVKIMLDQERWFNILSNSQKTIVNNQLQMLVNQDLLMEGQEEIQKQLIKTSTQIITNQESWFKILNTQQKDLLHGQTNLNFNQKAILRDTKRIMADLTQLQATVDVLSLEVKYNDELENLKTIQYWYNGITEGPYGDMELDFNSNSFKEAALDRSTGIQKSLLILNEMLTGGRRGISAKTIYETNKPSFCNEKTFEYFDSLLSVSGILLNTATLMDDRTLSQRELKILKMYQINHESQYILNCGCNPGLRRGQRIDLNSFVSTLQENLPLQSRNQVFEEVLSLKESHLMAKMLIIQKHFNFNLNKAIIDLVRRTPKEDIETIIKLSMSSPNPQEDLELLSRKYTCYKDEDHPLQSSQTDVAILGGLDDSGTTAAVTSGSMSSTFCKAVPPLPTPSSSHSAAIWKHKYLLSCGGIGKAGPTDICYTFDLTNTQDISWSKDQIHLPKKAAAHTLTSLGTPDGSVAFIGGAQSKTVFLDTTYKLQGSQWIPGPQMKTVRWKHCTAMTGTDTLIVTGGQDAATKLNSVEMIDFATKTTTSLPPMNQARAYHGCSTVNTPNGKVLVVAGGGTNTVEMLELSWSARAWTTITALPSIRSTLTLVPTPDMEGLRVIGGTDENKEYMASILQMRPFKSSGTWETVPGATMIRKKHAGVVVPLCRK